MTVEDDSSCYRSILRNLADLESTEVQVGLFTQELHDNGYPIVEAAIVNEYGSDDGKISERPAHRATFDKNETQIGNRIEKAVTTERLKDGTVEQALDKVGDWYEDKLKKAVKAWRKPPNKESTVKRKGFNNPLIHTEKTVNSIESKIVKRD